MTDPGRAGIRIGLTGPIGCGKSTVAGWLAERGAVVVDADRIAREVTRPGEPVLDAVIARFGPEYRLADGSLDRPALGRAVFGDPSALADLEAIVHPAVRSRILVEVEAAERADAPAVVVEAIRLVEAGYAASCDEVWLITCVPATQRERLAARGLPATDAAQRIAAQAEAADRLAAAATRIVDTSAGPAETRAAVDRAYDEAIAARQRPQD